MNYQALQKFGVHTNKGFLDVLTDEFTEQPTMNSLTSEADAKSKAITFNGKVVKLDVYIKAFE